MIFWDFLRMFSVWHAFLRGTHMTFGFSIFSLQVDQVVSMRYMYIYIYVFFSDAHGNSWLMLPSNDGKKKTWAIMVASIPQVNKNLVTKQWGVTPKSDRCSYMAFQRTQWLIVPGSPDGSAVMCDLFFVLWLLYVYVLLVRRGPHFVTSKQTRLANINYHASYC